MLSFFPLDVLDEIWDLIESVSEGFLTYSYIFEKPGVLSLLCSLRTQGTQWTCEDDGHTTEVGNKSLLWYLSGLSAGLLT